MVDRMIRTFKQKQWLIISLVLLAAVFMTKVEAASIAEQPLFLSSQVPPLNLLVMGRDHKLYYEAYNDASDLNDDGALDVGYKPADIDYYGYFNSYSCYEYDSGNHRFSPTSSTADKTCSGSSEWSGDFLNYLTTSRIDALRKVLYGGYRSTDSTTTTVLERAYVPQNAHAWGKEYTSVSHDGYDIRDYTPLNLPTYGTRHLFASVTLLNTTEPLLRVLNDSKYRIWEWVSIERPVAGSKCRDGKTGPACTASASTLTEIVPESSLSDLTQKIYAATSASSATDYASFDTLVTNYASAANLILSQSPTTINGSRPYDENDFINIIKGKIEIPYAGQYTFFIDGDDAVDFSLDYNSDGFASNDLVVGWYGAHSASGSASSSHSGTTINLAAGTYNIQFRHQELTGEASWALYWGRYVPASTMTDYSVRTEVCKSPLLETNCKAYSDGTTTYYKPTGLLHDYGEGGKMLFGLLTGSYAKNTQGGVLRKAVSSFTDEVNSQTGQFTAVNGIVNTINNIKTTHFGGDYQYGNCGWIVNRPMNNGECNDWGNPIAEMMYEGIRYFAGKASPTPEFMISATGNDDASLGLPLATWDDPYTAHPVCSQPFELVISDINPSFDSDTLPGAYGQFGGSSPSGAISGLDVNALGNTIWSHEYGTTEKIFIGQSGTDYDNAPTPKDASSFGTVRGLAPEEPTKQGSYYPASLSYFAKINDLNAASGDQKMSTFSVALASPLPEIKIPVGDSTIRLVPFAKSVGGSAGGHTISASSSAFQPTDSIIDFYVESLTDTSGVFSINYEDVEQGADHDMDAIVKYSYVVNADNTLTVTLNSTYAAGGVIQHMGYIISGTTADGIYLEVRDVGTNSDPDYFLDTPPGELPGGNWNDGDPLPLTATRKFSPASSSGGNSASFLKNPLWYAAKYGFFDESVNGATQNDLPDSVEYDSNGDGDPDNYFLVTNALTLSEQLRKAFDNIVGVNTSAAAVATNSTRLGTDTFIYQASFNTDSWGGRLTAYPLLSTGGVGPSEWSADTILDAVSSPSINRSLFTYNPTSASGVTLTWDNLNAAQQTALNTDDSGTVDSRGALRLAYLQGERCNEEQNLTNTPTSTCYNGFFRDRTTILGDIVNSDPWYVGQQNYGYEKLPGTEGSSYLTYRSSADYLSRIGTLYVGANDGMLHAFNAGARDSFTGEAGGSELFAYMPNAVFSQLSALTSPSYVHQYYVDGPARATDAYIDVDIDGTSQWETVLVGSLGGGGKALFALRVTDPENFTAADVLWEIDSTTTGFEDLGYVLDQPFIVRMANGEWVAVFGNGYDSSSGHAVLYIVDLVTGALVKSIDVGGTLNGLSGVSPVDYNNGAIDRIVDTIYAGDLLGQLWKFDVSSGNTAQWDSAFSHNQSGTKVADPLFIARGSSGNVQPITARPEVGIATATAATNDIMIYFGTGQYYATNDNIVSSPAAIESMYGILDNGSAITTTDRSDLVEQTIEEESSVSGSEARVLSSNSVDYASKRGWYLDLESPASGAQGERVVERAQLSKGYLVYVTLIPSIDVCEFGGDSWTMIVDPETGGNLNKSIFDLNGDNSYDANDYLNGAVVSGKKSTNGIISSPAIITAGDRLHLVTSGTDNNINDDIVASSDELSGRGSWRQVR